MSSAAVFTSSRAAEYRKNVMKKPAECNSMKEIREAIDHIDNNIVELIALRSRYVQKAAEFKKSETAVRDPERVEKVISSKKTLAEKYGISPDLVGNIYAIMIDFFVSEEMKEWKKGKE